MKGDCTNIMVSEIILGFMMLVDNLSYIVMWVNDCVIHRKYVSLHDYLISKGWVYIGWGTYALPPERRNG